MPRKTPANLPQSGGTWYFFVQRLRTWITPEDEPPIRPYLSLVFDLTEGLIRGYDIGLDPTPSEALKMIFKTMTHPEEGFNVQPERPLRFFFEDKQWLEVLRSDLEKIDVECRHRPQTELRRDLVADLEAYMHGDTTPIQGLLRQKGVSLRQLEAFFKAAADFYRAAPWVVLGNEHLLALTVGNQKEPYYVLVMGQGGVEYGLGIYHTWEQLERQHSDYDRLEDVLGSEGQHVLFFNDITEVPFDDLDAVETYHWDLAGPQAYPVPYIFVSHDDVRRPSKDDLLWYEAALIAIPIFINEHLSLDAQGQPEPAEASIPVKTSTGKVSVVVKYPGGDLPTSRISELIDLPEYDQDEEEFSSLPFDRRAIEGSLAHFTAGFGEQALDAKTAEAQDLMYEAWDEPNPAKRLALAHKALTISQDCADAYVLLAEEEAASLLAAIELYQQGVEAGRRALGDAYFEENAGHFWGLIETRPFMRAMDGLAYTLRESGQREEALSVYRELLRLNPSDNQGIRYILTDLLLDLNRDAELGELLDGYDDASAVWNYTRALYLFRQTGASQEATRVLKMALENNPFVLRYLIGEKRIPLELPDTIGFGDENEAQVYAASHLNYWRRTAGAIDWLKKHAKVAMKAIKKQKKPRRSKGRFRVGDTVQVKPGVKDPDNPQDDLGGWQGEVIEIDESEDGLAVLIAWDAETLAQIPFDSIDASMEDGFDWSVIYLAEDELAPAKARSSKTERQKVLKRLETEHAWGHLGEQGRRIRELLQGIDLNDEMAAFQVWDAHLRKVLKLPYKAEIVEDLEIEGLDYEDRVQVTGFAPVDEDEGVMVQVKKGRRQSVVALVDLEPIDRRSANYNYLDDYLIWYSEM